MHDPAIMVIPSSIVTILSGEVRHMFDYKRQQADNCTEKAFPSKFVQFLKVCEEELPFESNKDI